MLIFAISLPHIHYFFYNNLLPVSATCNSSARSELLPLLHFFSEQNALQQHRQVGTIFRISDFRHNFSTLKTGCRHMSILPLLYQLLHILRSGNIPVCQIRNPGIGGCLSCCLFYQTPSPSFPLYFSKYFYRYSFLYCQSHKIFIILLPAFVAV